MDDEVVLKAIRLCVVLLLVVMGVVEAETVDAESVLVFAGGGNYE